MHKRLTLNYSVTQEGSELPIFQSCPPRHLQLQTCALHTVSSFCMDPFCVTVLASDKAHEGKQFGGDLKSQSINEGGQGRNSRQEVKQMP